MHPAEQQDREYKSNHCCSLRPAWCSASQVTRSLISQKGKPGTGSEFRNSSEIRACFAAQSVTRRYLGRTALAPVPLPQNPAASLVDPAMRYPVGTRPWRLFPPARDPRITLAIVVVISPNPNIASARSMIPLLDNHPRRRDADHNIGRCGVENQRTRKDQSDQWLKNHNTIPFLLPDCESFHRQAHYQALLRLRA